MSKTIINFWLDLLLMIQFLCIAWVSTVLHLIFPAGTSAKGWVLWGWNYNEWRGFEYVLLAVFTLSVLVHVMLHWSWVCGVISAKILHRKGKPDYGMQTIYGVILLIGLLILVGSAVAAAQFSIVKPY